ncbi:MAG TPA: hypothetical protein VFI97_04245 [Arthrobacter sp.]|nr:hypothetical protein [Arthrobacter sp.]
MNRPVKVAQMQLINKWTYLGVPALVIVASFLISWALWAIIPGEGTAISGAGQAVMWYFLVLGIQSLTLTFPFSQAMSVSRRNFYVGTLGLFALVALAVSLLYVVLGFVEEATNGWGVGGAMFAIPWVSDGPWIEPLVFYFLAMVLLFMIGFWAATVYMRWRVIGMVILSISAAALLLALVALATWTESWPAVGLWFTAQTPLTISGWAALTCVVLAGGSYLTLRKATP